MFLVAQPAQDVDQSFLHGLTGVAHRAPESQGFAHARQSGLGLLHVEQGGRLLVQPAQLLDGKPLRGRGIGGTAVPRQHVVPPARALLRAADHAQCIGQELLPQAAFLDLAACFVEQSVRQAQVAQIEQGLAAIERRLGLGGAVLAPLGITAPAGGFVVARHRSVAWVDLGHRNLQVRAVAASCCGTDGNALPRSTCTALSAYLGL